MIPWVVDMICSIVLLSQVVLQPCSLWGFQCGFFPSKNLAQKTCSSNSFHMFLWRLFLTGTRVCCIHDTRPLPPEDYSRNVVGLLAGAMAAFRYCEASLTLDMKNRWGNTGTNCIEIPLGVWEPMLANRNCVTLLTTSTCNRATMFVTRGYFIFNGRMSKIILVGFKLGILRKTNTATTLA